MEFVDTDLRDFFAANMLHGIFLQPQPVLGEFRQEQAKQIAELAYMVADAMMAERKK